MVSCLFWAHVFVQYDILNKAGEKTPPFPFCRQVYIYIQSVEGMKMSLLQTQRQLFSQVVAVIYEGIWVWRHILLIFMVERQSSWAVLLPEKNEDEGEMVLGWGKKQQSRKNEYDERISSSNARGKYMKGKRSVLRWKIEWGLSTPYFYNTRWHYPRQVETFVCLGRMFSYNKFKRRFK